MKLYLALIWNSKTMLSPIKLIGIFSSEALAVEGIVQNLVSTATEQDYTDYNFNTREAIKEKLPNLLKWFQENSTSVSSIYENKNRIRNEFDNFVLQTSPYSNGPGIEFYSNYNVEITEIELNEISNLELALKRETDNFISRSGVAAAVLKTEKQVNKTQNDFK